MELSHKTARIILLGVSLVPLVWCSLLYTFTFMCWAKLGRFVVLSKFFSNNNAMNDAPISTICRNIEIDIKEMMDDPSIPPKLEPYNNVML